MNYETGVHIAQAFARSLRPQERRQLPLWSSDDYERLPDLDLRWRCDTFVDDDYIFGAHIVVGRRIDPTDAPNSYLQSLFIHRYPYRGTQRDREYIVQWLRNERPFFQCRSDWYREARRTFIDWYAHVNEYRDKIRETIDHGSTYRVPIPQDMTWRFQEEFLYSRPAADFKFTDITIS